MQVPAPRVPEVFPDWSVQTTEATSLGSEIDCLGPDPVPTSYQDIASGEAPNITKPMDEFS